MNKRLLLLGLFSFLIAFASCDTSVNNPEITKIAEADTERLPLGDGKISAEPRRGYVWSCQQTFWGGGGAHREGEWILKDGTWSAKAKTVEVDGDVVWDNYKYEIKLEGDTRKLIGNGLPNHQTGVFPVQPTDDAHNYDKNPNAIKETQIVYNLPAVPALADAPSCVPMGAIGVMKTGVVIFNAVDLQGKDAVAHEIQDKCSGHPETTGQYHYHNLSKCIEETANSHSELVGYAIDGFGIFGMFGENGKELTNADLDECHGHTHEILWDGKRVVMYHYHATKEYPYTIGCLRGVPVAAQK